MGQKFRSYPYQEDLQLELLTLRAAKNKKKSIYRLIEIVNDWGTGIGGKAKMKNHISLTFTGSAAH